MSTSPVALSLCLQGDIDEYINIPDQDFTDFWPGMSTKQARVVHFRKNFFKKFEGAKSADADSKALDKFLQCNSRCAGWNFDSAKLPNSLFELVHGELKKTLHNWLMDGPVPKVDLCHLFDKADTGPGASIGAAGNDFFRKLFTSKLTCTSDYVFYLYKEGTRLFPTWNEAEVLRSLRMGGYDVVVGNRLSFVPKTSEISRTICIEPNLNMFFQKGIGTCLEEILHRETGINLSTQQDLNRRLARIGSIHESYGTIDLQSASDSISLSLIDEILPEEIVSLLRIFRSRFVTLPSGEVVRLSMVSSMGNGFTFPLQTMIFAALVNSVYRALGIPLRHPRISDYNYAVFGDDIIVETKAYDVIVKCLEFYGFRVNMDKSFNSGPFRESCGHDYFRGENIRPVFCLRLEKRQDLYSLINRLNVWSCNSGILLTRTIGYLLKRVRFLPIPIWEDDCAGVKVPFSLLQARRYNRNQALVYTRFVPVVKKVVLQRLKQGSFDSEPLPWELRNSPGMLLAFVKGSIRNGAITIRMNSVSYTSRRAVAINWDKLSPSCENLRDGLLPVRRDLTFGWLTHSVDSLLPLPLTAAGWGRWNSFPSLNLDRFSA